MRNNETNNAVKYFNAILSIPTLPDSQYINDIWYVNPNKNEYFKDSLYFKFVSKT